MTELRVKQLAIAAEMGKGHGYVLQFPPTIEEVSELAQFALDKGFFDTAEPEALLEAAGLANEGI